MMERHLSDVEVLDAALEGQPDGPAREHLAACAACAANVAALREARSWAVSAQDPEPGDLFWRALRSRIGARVEAEAERGKRVRPRWLWSFAAAAGLAAVMLAWPLLPGAGRSTVPVLAAWEPLAVAEEDAGLLLVADVVPAADEDVTSGAECETCLAGLTDDESVAMIEALRQEMGRKS
jgi:anti-sigma factor RsiW